MDIKNLVVVKDSDKGVIAGLPHIFENLMTAHSAFQIKNFILNDVDCPTNPGKYHQAVRELWSRYTNLISLTYEYKKMQNEIKLHEIRRKRYRRKVDITPDKLDAMEIYIMIDQEDLEIEHKGLGLQSLQKRADECMREIKVLVEVLEKLDSMIGPELRSENGLPDREKSELSFWLHKQYIAEQMHDNDRKMVPFNKILGLKNGKVPTIGMDTLGRVVILSDEEAKAIGNTDKPVRLIGGNVHE